MNQKKYSLMHWGLALGDYALFYWLQVWVSMLFSVGVGMGVSTKIAALPADQIESALTTLTLEHTDVLQLFFYMMLLTSLFVLLLPRVRSIRGIRQELSLQRVLKPQMLWVVLPLAAAFYFAVLAAMSLVPEDSFLMQQYSIYSNSVFSEMDPVLSFLIAVVFAPIVEELLFRGLIYGHLKKALPRHRWLALLLQAFFFGISHGQLLWILYTFLFGLLLGLLLDYFDFLPATICTHLLFNLCNYLPIPEGIFASVYSLLIVLFASLLTLSVGLLLLILFHRQKNPSIS